MTREQTNRGLALAIVAMATGVAFESIQGLTGLGGHPLEQISDKWVYTAVEVIAVVVCAARDRKSVV